MKAKYKKYIQSQNRFNKWELKYISNLSMNTKLDQFTELFELEHKPKISEKKHKEHINTLIIHSSR